MRDQTGETVNLAAAVDDRLVAVARELSRYPVSVLTRIGEVWSLNETPKRWAAQAFRSDGSCPDSMAERLAHIRRCALMTSHTESRR